MIRKRKVIILVFIVLLAFVLRFFRLGTLPALNADEAAIGYNAYSLIKTGKDEHSNSWPIHFQSFNDYKPGLYFYIVLPFVSLFDLNVLSVRVPAALMGVFTVLIVYFLVKELFEKEDLALVSSFFLAISPWHVHFSRGGWEVNVATFFISLGVWLFLKALKKPKYLVLSAVSFVASLYTYHAARLVVPLLVISFFIIFRKQLLKNIKSIVVAGILGAILLTPLIIDFTKSSVVSRAAGVGLFADTGPLARINEQRGEHTNFESIVPKLLHNKGINYSLAFIENWLEHFWGEFLFLSGDDIQRNKVPEMGVMYMFDFVLFGLGLITIIKKPKGWGLVILWLLIAPTAAALTFQSPHALRAHNMVIPLVIISSQGLIALLKIIKTKVVRRNLRILSNCLLFSLILWGLARYLHQYYVHMNKEYPFSSQYGVEEMVEFTLDVEDDFEKVFITDKYDQPYILFLFYSKYPPQDFQANHFLTSRDVYGFSTVREFDKYYFQEIDFDSLQPDNPNSLIVGTDEEIPEEANIIKKIYFPNGQVAFKIVAN